MSSVAPTPEPAAPTSPLRFVTAASLFDGHDASINIIRRMLQGAGAEVIHLGHDRGVDEVVDAAVQEDADGIAISSYQGGHVEYFTYMIERLAAREAAHVRVFGGGGGVIVPSEVALLHERGVARLYTPRDGQTMGLQGMIDHMMATAEAGRSDRPEIAGLAALPAPFSPSAALREEGVSPASADIDADAEGGRGEAAGFGVHRHGPLARLLSAIEDGVLSETELAALERRAGSRFGAGHKRGRDAAGGPAPVLGITGTGGSGKSSLSDELVRRLRIDQDDRVSVALLAVDPTRRKSGGALLGDRIRMNAFVHERLFMRSVATRGAAGEVPASIGAMIAACRLAGVDLVIVETPGIGQGDAGIADIGDVSLYVMTSEFGAASQLEKIDMLDFADVIAINKIERRGGDDALRDVRKQVQRNREAFAARPEDMPVYGTVASRFDDDGVTALYQALATRLADRGLVLGEGRLPRVDVTVSTHRSTLVPLARQRYLAEIAECVRGWHRESEAQDRLGSGRQQRRAAKRSDRGLGTVSDRDRRSPGRLDEMASHWWDEAGQPCRSRHPGPGGTGGSGEPVPRRGELVYTVTRPGHPPAARRADHRCRGRSVPRVSGAVEPSDCSGELACPATPLLPENLRSSTLPLQRRASYRARRALAVEDPTRMFAGRGHARASPIKRRSTWSRWGCQRERLSTAFDSVTLYGRRLSVPARRGGPDAHVRRRRRRGP